MGQVNWTPSQRDIINARGQNLLVSAGAGSGKTTVMIERIANLILDKDKPTPISKFLIISFTKASASDMKNKLIKKLSEIPTTPYVLEQLDDVLTSDVSNLHSFCARLLKSYFYEVGLDPTFMVLDETQSTALKEKAIAKLFSQKTASGDSEFYELIDIFAKKRKDTGLKDIIFKIHSFMCSLPNKDDWFEQTINTLYDDDLNTNTSAKIINAHMVAESQRIIKEIGEMREECQKAGSQKLVENLNCLESRVLNIRKDQGYWENARRIVSFERIPNISIESKDLEWLKIKVQNFKKTITKRIEKLQEYAVVSDLENVQINLQKTQKIVYMLYKLEKEFVEIFDAMKKEKGGLDFNDLEENTLKVLSNPVILDEIKNKYEYIMVDEYQDINSVQEKILTLLSKDDNRFMVGDVKQSIYRFRLCDPQIFLDKYNKYKNDVSAGTLIRLNENFRSKKTILDFVNAIFIKTMTNDFGGVDYGADAMLVAGSEGQKDEKTRAGILIADTSVSKKQKQDVFDVYSVKDDDQSAMLEIKGRAEGILIADKIATLMTNEWVKDGGTLRRLDFSDITILVPSRTAYLDKIVDTLRAKGIPVSTDVESDCFEDDYVFGLKSFLEVIACQKVDYSLFGALKSKVFDFSANELSEICYGKDTKKFFYENLLEVEENDLVCEKTKEKVKNFVNLVNVYREKAKFLSAKDILKQIIKQTNLMPKICFEEESNKTKQKLSKFMATLGNKTVFEYLHDSSISEIKSEAVFEPNAVKVMTIHKSKGLEFKVVFLAMSAREFNLEGVKSNILISKDIGIGADYYDKVHRYRVPTIAKQAVKLLEARKTLEEQQRLLYVALTRATVFLYVVASTGVDKIKQAMPASPMCFLDFMGHMISDSEKYANCLYNVEITDAYDLVKYDSEKEIVPVVLQNQEIDQDDFDILNKKYEFEDDIQTSMKVAVTGVLKGEIEGQSFAEFVDDEHYSASSAKEGTLYHTVLANLNLENNAVNQISQQLNQMVASGIISEEDAKTISVENISKLLSNPEFKNLISGASLILKEKEFFCLHKNKTSSSVMQGIVDLLIIKDNVMIVLDYKTGNLSSVEKLAKYAEQVEIYASAMQKCYELPVVKKCIASINSGKLIFV